MNACFKRSVLKDAEALMRATRTREHLQRDLIKTDTALTCSVGRVPN